MSSPKIADTLKEISEVHAEMSRRTSLCSQKERAYEKSKERTDRLKEEASEAKKAVIDYQSTQRDASRKLLQLGSADPTLLQEILSASMRVMERESTDTDEAAPAKSARSAGAADTKSASTSTSVTIEPSEQSPAKAQ